MKPIKPTAIRHLYRQLLRSACRIPSVRIPEASAVKLMNDAVQKEVGIASVNWSQYLRYASAELKSYISETARRPAIGLNGVLMTYKEGQSVLKALESAGSGRNGALQVLQLILQLRHKQHAWSQHMADKYRSKGIEDFDGRIPDSWSQKFAFPIKPFASLSNDEREKRIKQELQTSKDHKYATLRKYLKELQQKHMLAVPNRLPYTDMDPPSQTVKKSSKIYRSTSVNAILQGYNTKYIEAVMVPEVEYLVNYHHKLKKLEEVVNRKGPYQVKIRVTNAAPVSIPFIQLPYSRLREMRNIALSVKNSTRAFTLLTLWETGNGDTTMKGPRLPDGAFNVGWFRKFGPNSIMYSRPYHERLCKEEAEWEVLMELQSLEGVDEKGKSVSMEDVRAEIQAVKQKRIDEWYEPLNVASESLKMDLEKSTTMYNSKNTRALVERRDVLQQRMNAKYDRLVKSYTSILDMLQRDKVSIHSDLVAKRMTTPAFNFDNTLIKNDRAVKRTRRGVGLLERRGLGLRLSDYMKQHNIQPYRIGMKFGKRFGFIKQGFNSKETVKEKRH